MHENSQTWIDKGRAEVRKYPSARFHPKGHILRFKQGEVLRRFKSEDTANKWARYRSDTHPWMKKFYNKSILTRGYDRQESK